MESLFQSVEKVDSIYHAFAFLVTHPDFMVEAARVLHVKVPHPLLIAIGLEGVEGTKGLTEDELQKATADRINKSSGTILVGLVTMVSPTISLLNLFTSIGVPVRSRRSFTPFVSESLASERPCQERLASER